ncbi:hypothetical protein E2C01_049476 [Portunus trituberculatus]|uniref:Uncharacterized protein n=1 Tax=Portunus trituberculatus TaxID=210409 RepID=A0A5B7GD94_PORTR|nr:hypothetical protein [Portunus trituberculatus]
MGFHFSCDICKTDSPRYTHKGARLGSAICTVLTENISIVNFILPAFCARLSHLEEFAKGEQISDSAREGNIKAT